MLQIVLNNDSPQILLNQNETIYDLYHLPKGITIEGDLVLSHLGLTELPDLSNIHVAGSFICINNKLTSLKGAPKSVGKNFYCAYNFLQTLEGAPRVIPGNFDCSNNHYLYSLQGSPTKILGNFCCSFTNLESLDNGPTVVNGDFDCGRTPLKSLSGAPILSKNSKFMCEHTNIDSNSYIPETILHHKHIIGKDFKAIIRCIKLKSLYEEIRRQNPFLSLSTSRRTK